MKTLNELIKAIAICSSDEAGCEDGCPFVSEGNRYDKCRTMLLRECLDYLKRLRNHEQGVDVQFDMDNYVTYCPECGNVLESCEENYCSSCGSKLRWDMNKWNKMSFKWHKESGG